MKIISFSILFAVVILGGGCIAIVEAVRGDFITTSLLYMYGMMVFSTLIFVLFLHIIQRKGQFSLSGKFKDVSGTININSEKKEPDQSLESDINEGVEDAKQ